MARPPLLALARLVRDDGSAPAPGPIALLGPPGALDRVAARLLAGGGERRALAPLGRADRPLLSSCVAVVACNLPLDEARRATHAKRPTVVLVPPGQDRYAYAALPRVGAENALPAKDGGAPDLEGLVERLAAVLPPEEASVLAARLPALAPAIRAFGLQRAAGRAAVVAAVTRRSRSVGPALTLVQAAYALRSARAHGLPPGRDRAVDVAGVVAAGLALRRAGRAAKAVSPRLGAAAVAYVGTLAVGRALSERHRREAAPRVGSDGP
jgi:hypothetical protein